MALVDMVRGRQVVEFMTNKSGGSVAAGDVVIIDTGNDRAFTTTTSGQSTSVFGVVAESIANNATGRVVTSGYVPLVNVNASVTRGHFAETHTVAKQATGNSARRTGSFARFLTGGTTPEAHLFGLVDSISSGNAMASDTLWDAKGDLAVGTGADTAAKLTAGANGKVPTYASGETTGILPSYPPGYILDYVEITSPVTVSGTSEGAATTIITGTSQAYAAEPIWVEFYCPDMQDSGAGFCIVHLWDGGTVLGRLGIFAGATGERWPGGSLKVKLTPTAATHQYIVKGQVDASSSTIGAGNKGSSAYMPAFLAVTKA